MKKIHVILYFLISNAAFAVNEPLKVVIPHYSPPFILQSANNQFFGFDIEMMDYICRTIKRTCQYQPIVFEKLLSAVENKEADVGLGSITITPDRATHVNFTAPYLPSISQILVQAKLAQAPFSLRVLDNKRIGMKLGSIFATQLQIMDVKTPTIVYYPTDNAVVDALNTGQVDLAILDKVTADYWQNYSSGLLVTYGDPLPFGAGLGIAVNRDENSLLVDINQALSVYLKSSDFKLNYQIYFEHFEMN